MKNIIILSWVGWLSIIPAVACLWDYDTVEMEREQFPTVLEILSGKIVRHSPAFYYWRIKDRTKALGGYPDSLGLYDDIAVAYSKLGNQKKALDIIRKKEEKQPNQYKTYANMGTFFMLDNRLDSAKIYIQKALEIEPNAHFGREKYQLYLAEYLINKSKGGKIRMPLDRTVFNIPQDYYLKINERNFYGFVLKKYNQSNEKVEKLPIEALDEAIKGVTGMLYFADMNSPILLEVLGDLLTNTGHRKAARQLASRAYLKAGLLSNSTAQKIYLKRIKLLLETQYANERRDLRANLNILRIQLKRELEEGNQYRAGIAKDEWEWILAHDDVDKRFAAKYYESSSVEIVKDLITRPSKNEVPLDTLAELIYPLDTLTNHTRKLLDSLFLIQIEKSSIEDLPRMKTVTKTTEIGFKYWGILLVGALFVIVVVMKRSNKKNEK